MARPDPPAAMPRGRVRKHNAAIPAHIDQGMLPRGIYFNPRGIGHWYVLDGKSKRYVADGRAKLSELHQIMEAPAQSLDGTVDALWDLYRASKQYTDLAKSTRTGYASSSRLVRDYVLKDGRRVGDARAMDLNRPMLQRLIDKLAIKDGTPTPSRAVHAARLLAVLTSWGANRGHCPGAIANKLDLPREVRNARMPETDAHDAIVAFARARGAMKRQQGAVAPYLWAVAEIAYLCRLRSVEVCDMTEARATDAGLLCVRRKGSASNVVTWSPRLRAAWLFLLAERDRTWKRRKMPIPMRAVDRPLVTSLTGDALPRRALTQAWRKMMVLAVAEGVITAPQRFGLHGLKHRGVTDTEGTRADKRQASGHQTEAMVARYDHHIPTVPAAGKTGGKIPEKP